MNKKLVLADKLIEISHILINEDIDKLDLIEFEKVFNDAVKAFKEIEENNGSNNSREI